MLFCSSLCIFKADYRVYLQVIRVSMYPFGEIASTFEGVKVLYKLTSLLNIGMWFDFSITCFCWQKSPVDIVHVTQRNQYVLYV